MIRELLLALYGSIVLGGVFLIWNLVRAASKEVRERGPGAAKGTYFWLTLNHAAQAFFIGGICAQRGYDIWTGAAGAATSRPFLLVLCFAGLLFTKTAFNYVSTVPMRRGRLWWRVLLVVTLAWWAFIFLFVDL